MARNNKNKKAKEYSKVLLIQESALLWVLTLGMMGLAYLCIINGYLGTLPWLAAMVAFPWTAYGVSQTMYYRKSEKENTKGGIKFESVMAEVNALYGNTTTQAPVDWTVPTETIDTSISDSTEPKEQIIDLDYGI
jgi:hypothetical protein